MGTQDNISYNDMTLVNWSNVDLFFRETLVAIFYMYVVRGGWQAYPDTAGADMVLTISAMTRAAAVDTAHQFHHDNTPV